MSEKCFWQQQKKKKKIEDEISLCHTVIPRRENPPTETRYNITGLRRFLLVCSHVRGWCELQGVGGWGGRWGRCLAVIQGRGVGGGGVVNKAACVIYGVELQHRNVLRGCTHLQKPFSGSVSLSREPEVHVETRCRSSCLEIHRMGGGASWGLPPKRGDGWETHTHKSHFFPHQKNEPPSTSISVLQWISLSPQWPSLPSVCGVTLFNNPLTLNGYYRSVWFVTPKCGSERRSGTAHCRWQEIYLWAGKQKQNASFIHHKSREADCFKHERTTQEYTTNHALQLYLTLTLSTRCLLMFCQCKINHWRKYIHGEIDQLSFRIHL